MQAGRDRQKSYADLKRKPMEFQVGDKVMLKVLPWKGVVRFGKRGKLNPRYVGPFKVLEKVGEVAYKLELPEELSRVQNTFHVSNLKKCHADEPLAVPLDGLHFDNKLHFVKEPVEIVDREVKRLKQIRIPLVKVRWNSKRGPEFTWERKDKFRKKYPRLFTKTAPSISYPSKRADQGLHKLIANALLGIPENANLDFKGTEGSRQLTSTFLIKESCLALYHYSRSSSSMPRQTLKKMDNLINTARTGEIKKTETEMWNLNVKGTDAVKASKPKTMQEAIEFTAELMDDKTHAYAERQVEKKRKYDDLSNNNQNQQQQNKRHNTGQAYTAGNSDRKPHAGSKPLCSKCDYNHEGPCPPRCNNCKKVGHLAKDCRSRPANANNNNRNNNNNNQKGNAGNDRALVKVYVVGNTGENLDNIVAGTFLLNNRYAYILFDTGVQIDFVSLAFAPKLTSTPSTLDHYYDVELADGRIIGFDAIIGMDWLAKYQAVIVCAEKIKYMQKGFPIFLAHVTAKEVEDKSKKKQTDDVPIVRNFPEVFPEDLPCLPPTRQVEFQMI
ncbi:putative reverse transcriptase domain-containing protein [Tanacetum coccineum]